MLLENLAPGRGHSEDEVLALAAWPKRIENQRDAALPTRFRKLEMRNRQAGPMGEALAHPTFEIPPDLLEVSNILLAHSARPPDSDTPDAPPTTRVEGGRCAEVLERNVVVVRRRRWIAEARVPCVGPGA